MLSLIYDRVRFDNQKHSETKATEEPLLVTIKTDTSLNLTETTCHTSFTACDLKLHIHGFKINRNELALKR